MLRRTAFKRPERIRQPLPAPQPVRQVAAVVMGAVVAAQPKAKKAKASKAVQQQHKAKLVLLGCMACRRLDGAHEPGGVELHHYRGGGWGKGDWRTLMPLCVEHHRGDMGIHGLGTKGFAAHYGFDQQELLNDALRELGLVPTK